MTQALPPVDKRSSPESNTIYVDLDALLDTRLGTLATLKDEYAVNALHNGYTTRDRDEFPDVPYEVFKLAYEKRDADTLAMSTFTNVFTFLLSCLKSSFEEAVTNPNARPIQIQVNTYPYDLEEDEKAAISIAVSRRLKQMADVSVVCVSDAFLTPKYCKDTFAIMVRYDYQSWLKIHHGSHAFEKDKMPGVSIVAPAIYQTRPNEQEMEELKSMNIHPFTATEFTMAPFFQLKLLEIDVFCISKEILRAKPLERKEELMKQKDGIKSEEPKPSGQNAEQPKPQAQPSDDGFELF